jgi:methionyl-tRNA formyltransferase
MNLALFAAGAVGKAIAGFLAETPTPPRVLILDAAGSADERGEIARLCPGARVLTSDVLATEGPSAFHEAAVDLGVLAWWPYILKGPTLALPRLGTLNCHPSLLPHNRGKHYNFWNLVEDVPFGVTIHWVDPGIDSGDIAFQRPIAKSWEDDGRTLYEKAQRATVALFRASYPRMASGRIPRIPQPAGQGSFHLARELEAASRIDLDRRYGGRELLNLLRARTFSPHPAAWFRDGEERYEVRVEIRRVEAEGRPRTERKTDG